jgi:hypothetical protein
MKIFRIKNSLLLLLLIFRFLVHTASAASANEEAQWRTRQQKAIRIVQRMIQIGVPSYRCTLYVPGLGVCYMKMTPQRIDDTAEFSQVFVDDMSEVIDIATKFGEEKLLEKNEQAFVQSRFQNTVYLRIISKDLVHDFEKTPRSNLLALRKLLEDLTTYVDGSYKDQKTDVWVSINTENFNRGLLPVSRVTDEGVVIPGKAIVIYQRVPGLWSSEGEKALADKLFEVIKNSKILVRFFADYELVVGMESSPQLLFARYPIRRVESLKREDLKYFKYVDK